ncbi:hypothetical protein AF72_03075 [Xylella taiwanensis]|uniref:Uncharacterized protein n=1 Tax=Xylella taiwanensis TaxID=1444770 RepID=Z9JM58_9GAMM|nr:hypothetical protein AF72_03075 [Xylella taiwanensis]
MTAKPSTSGHSLDWLEKWAAPLITFTVEGESAITFSTALATIRSITIKATCKSAFNQDAPKTSHS